MAGREKDSDPTVPVGLRQRVGESSEDAMGQGVYRRSFTPKSFYVYLENLYMTWTVKSDSKVKSTVEISREIFTMTLR